MTEFKQRSSRCVIWVAIFMCIVFLGGGIAIGYFAIPRPKEKSHKLPDYQERCTSECARQASVVSSCAAPLPRHYTAYYLAGSNITVDGKLDDEAWQEVPFTENFVDIRGSKYGAPPVKTRVKVRYDDEAVYVGAYLEEPHVWATYTEKDSRIYQENAFEIFFDVDNSMSMYKEIEINALGTTWDLMLSRAYMDGGSFTDWEGIQDKGVYTDGEVNNASVKATYWSTEMSFPFEKLNENTTRTHGKPLDGEMWFTIFARPRYDLEVLPNNTYMKKPGTDASWYSWNPTGAVNLHLPSKWGLLFFDESAPSTAAPSVTSARWLTYQGLFDVFNVMKSVAAQRGPYTNDEDILNIPPYITSGTCFMSYKIELPNGGFLVSLESKSEPGVIGHIDQDRHVTFTTKQ